MINEVSACFKTSGVQYGPVDCTPYHLFLPCLPQNSGLIVVDAKDITKKILYKSNIVNPNDSPINNVFLLLFNNHYYRLTSLALNSFLKASKGNNRISKSRAFHNVGAYLLH